MKSTVHPTPGVAQIQRWEAHGKIGAIFEARSKKTGAVAMVVCHDSRAKKASGKCRNRPRPSDYRQRRSLLGRVAETPSLRELFLSFLTLAEGGCLA